MIINVHSIEGEIELKISNSVKIYTREITQQRVKRLSKAHQIKIESDQYGGGDLKLSGSRVNTKYCFSATSYINDMNSSILSD